MEIKPKVLRELKNRNDKLKEQYEMAEFRCIHKDYIIKNDTKTFKKITSMLAQIKTFADDENTGDIKQLCNQAKEEIEKCLNYGHREEATTNQSTSETLMTKDNSII